VEAQHRPLEAANRNFMDAYRKLVQHTGGQVRRFGGVFAFTTGVPLGIFNGCVVLEASQTEDLHRAIDWAESLQLPFRVWTDALREASVRTVAAEHGLVPDGEPEPVMVMRCPATPPPPPIGISVVEAGAAEFRQVAEATGVPAEFGLRLYRESFAADPDVQMFVANLEGRPVSKSIAIRTGNVTGVYDVGTVSDARRRGAGSAVTWAAVAAGCDWGCRSIVLQASPMGLPVYRAMGFEVIGQYTIFRPPPRLRS
jgi:hypothetical protein